MIIIDALRSECVPYSISELTLQKSLIDLGLNPADEYSQKDREKVNEAVLNVLKKLLVLKSESEDGFSQNFDIEALRKRIQELSGEDDRPTVRAV